MTITVSALHIYPVKSLGGITLAQCEATSRGFKFDRRYMLVDKHHAFVTQRQFPSLAGVWTELLGNEIELSAPDHAPLRFPVESPSLPTRNVKVWLSLAQAHSVSAEADAWLSDYLGAEVRLVYMPDTTERRSSPKYAKNQEIVSFADGYAFLLTNEASLFDLNTRIEQSGGRGVPMNRFRANIVVKGADAWAEDAWLNRTIRIGDATFQAVKPCRRCQVTTTDQTTGAITSSEPLRTLASFRNTPKGPLFGMNLVPVTLGTVQPGDTVLID